MADSFGDRQADSRTANVSRAIGSAERSAAAAEG